MVWWTALQTNVSDAVATEPWPEAGAKLTRSFSLSLCLRRRSRFSLAVSETFSL